MSVMLNDIEENLYLQTSVWLDRMPGIALNRDKLYAEVCIKQESYLSS